MELGLYVFTPPMWDWILCKVDGWLVVYTKLHWLHMIQLQIIKHRLKPNTLTICLCCSYILCLTRWESNYSFLLRTPRNWCFQIFEKISIGALPSHFITTPIWITPSLQIVFKFIQSKPYPDVSLRYLNMCFVVVIWKTLGLHMNLLISPIA